MEAYNTDYYTAKYFLLINLFHIYILKYNLDNKYTYIYHRFCETKYNKPRLHTTFR